MSRLKERIEANPLPWFFGALIGAFLAGVGAYQGILSWSGYKVVRDEAALKFALRVEPAPGDASVAIGDDAAKFFQGMPLPDGPTEINVSRPGYRKQVVRLARNGATLVLSVPLPKLASLAPGDSVKYTGEKMTLNFKNVDVRAFFQILGDFTNVNVLIADGVKGSVTLHLRDVPWDQVVDIAAAQADLDVRRLGNVMLVDTR